MIKDIRERLASLYKDKSLLGFTLFNDQGELVHNESFSSDHIARSTVSLFMNCRLSLLKSGRKVQRFTIELDDIILIYCLIEEGHAVFTLDRECDLDAAAKILVPAYS